MHCSIESSQNKQINLLNLGWEKCRPGHTFLHDRNLYLLHYIQTGKGVLELNGTLYNLSDGEAFLIRPNEIARYTADTKEPWEYYYFAFNGTLVDSILEKTLFANNKVFAKISNDELASRIIYATIEAQGRNDLEFWALEQLFGFFNILHSAPKSKRNIKNDKNDLVSSIEEYILSHYSKPINVSDLSKMFGFNRSHLHRIFKTSTGRSIADFIIYARVQGGKRLLRETKLSATEIAKSIGYSNYSSFFKAFKTLEGITPTEFRNEAKNMTND